MGVTGLWKLIEPCGKPVPVETLEGKILAVDISIWLHQVVKGFQDNKGSALNNAHLLGLFNRLCKLLYYRVKPVFIFDGCVPQLKRDTIAKRQQQRNKLNTEADRIQALLLQSLAKEKVVQQALGTNAELLLKSPVKRTTKSTRAENSFDELFKLPELPAAEGKNAEHESDNNEESFTSCTDDYTSASATEDSSFDESNPRYAYNANLQSIDVRSQHFKNLPADVRHDILTDIKETRKQSSWGRLHELPSRSDDFSSFQMKRLLKRRAVQESLEQAEQEMGGRTLTYAELCNFFNEEGIITPTAIAEGTKQISSDENTRYLLVRDLKKKLTKPETDVVKCEPIKEEPETIQETKKTKPTADVKIKPEHMCKDELGDEFDEDLNLAIALSLEETQVYNENDYDYDSDQDLRLNREQSKQLRNAAKGPARAYMIEYGGMNEDEVENIMEKTQRGDINDTAYLERLLDISVEAPQTVIDNEEKPTSTSRLKANLADAKKANELESQELNLRVSDESDSDSDLVEVPDEAEPVAATAQSALAIVLDVNKPLAPQEDLFADIFEKTTEKKEKPEDHFVDILEKTTDNKEKLEAIKVMSETKPVADIIEIKDSQEAPQKLELPIEIKNSQDNGDKSKLLPEVKPLVVKPVADNAKMLAILDELKKQTEEVKNIQLSALKQSDSTIEISDDEAGKIPQVKAEIIEICDSDDNTKQATTTATTSKSPLQKTPSKNKTITEFFETAYFIKRTPEKPKEDENSTPPKVKSPFFVKKTPKSARKRAGEHEEQSDEAASPAKKLPKAAKALFEANEPELNEKKEASAPLNAEDIIKDAAEALKAQKTAEELDELAKTLAAERRELETERNRQDRMGMSISQRMNAECQELLRLFGVPFIVAPMEAEAQCAFLNAIELTNGTITDDSDIWLFGGRTVYKNFFAQNKHVLEFRAEQIEQSFNCDRKKLIQLACLVGSDYTTGVHGIGAVTALEILASFSCSTQDSPPSGDAHTRATIHKVIATLAKFRDWWLAHKNSSLPPGSSARLSLRKKLKNIELHEGFPSPAVVEAYLTPKVDDNKESFSWGIPDVESIREFTRKTFGWTTTKTDEILKPVLKKLNDKKLQGSLLNYFAVKGAVSVRELKVSKRVQTAIDKMSGKIDIETPEKPPKTTRPRRTKRKAAIETEKEDGEKSETLTATSGSIVKPTTVEDQAIVSKPRKSARLPNTNEVIPQRERDMEQMRKNKEKAAEILKKSAAQTKKRAAKKS